MNLSKGQKEEMELLEFFLLKPEEKYVLSDESSVRKYFEWTEQGKHKEEADTCFHHQPSEIRDKGFDILARTKKGILFNIEKWEEGVLEGTTPYFTLLGGYDKVVERKWYQFWKPKYTICHTPIPRIVVEKMKGQMFGGIDAEIIESAYIKILESSKKSK